MKWIGCLLGLFVSAGLAQLAPSDARPLTERASVDWLYWEDGRSAPPTWKSQGFDHSAWKRGAAPLGYGDDHFRTTLSYGEDSADKPITVLFRNVFRVAEIGQISPLRLEMMHDDGIIVYLNDKQLTRAYMPKGFVDMETPALHRSNTVEARYQTVAEAGDTLVQGRNVLAVEVHQSSSKSSDLGFDLALSYLHSSRRTRPL